MLLLDDSDAKEATSSATPTMKPIEAISMLAFCESSWSPHNSKGWNPWSRWSSSSSSSSSGTSHGSLLGNSCGSSKTSDDSCPKAVRFGTIQVREYPLMIGDSLCVQKGVPLDIEWEYREASLITVNYYERQRKYRKQGEALILDPATREQRLRSVGYTSQDLLDAIRAREVAQRTFYHF